jgi:hypothetical protein
VTTNIAVIEQEANEAICENRREPTEETAKIKREPYLSEEARSRYVGEARERAQAKYVEIIDGHDKAFRDRLEVLERNLSAEDFLKMARTLAHADAAV